MIVFVIQDDADSDIMKFNPEYDTLTLKEALQMDPELREMHDLLQRAVKCYVTDYCTNDKIEGDEEKEADICDEIVFDILDHILNGDYKDDDDDDIIDKLETNKDPIHRECICSARSGNPMNLDNIPESYTPITCNPHKSGRGRKSKRELQKRKHAPVNKARKPQRKRRKHNPEPLLSERFVIRTCRFTHTVYILFLDQTVTCFF